MAPELALLEVLQAARGLVRGAGLDPEGVPTALGRLTEFVETLGHTHLLARGWELRDRHSAYDAAYVALAELVDAPLVTCDAALARSSGPHCDVELVSLEPPGPQR